MEDFIQLDSGEEGYVVDIAWQHTILQDIRDNMVVALEIATEVRIRRSATP